MDQGCTLPHPISRDSCGRVLSSRGHSGRKSEKTSHINAHPLVLFHINIQGLNSKVLQLGVLLHDIVPDIVFVSEHWLLRDEITGLHFDGYKLVSYFGRSKFKRGGTAIFLRNCADLKMFNVPTKVVPSEKDFEFCVSELHTRDAKFIYICIYRSPSGNMGAFLTSMYELLDALYRTSKYIIVAGDFNFHFHSANDEDVQALIHLFGSYGLVSHIRGITRVSSGSQLDNIFSNVEERMIYSSYILTTDISDHYGQILGINIHSPISKHYIVDKRFYNSQNLLQFCESLRRESWEEVYLACGSEAKYSTFFKILYYYFDISFPLSKCRIELQGSKTVSKEIRIYSDYMKDLYVWYKMTNCQGLYSVYKTERKKYRKFLSDYHKSINEDKIAQSKNKSKTAWSIINRERNCKTSDASTICLRINDLVTEDPQVVAELFSSQFSLPFTEQYPSRDYRSSHCTVFLGPTDHHEIFRILMNLSNKYSCGLDGIPVYVLKFAAEHLCQPLSHIINECFTSQVFPSDLKKAKVVPIYKKGDRKNSNNYRPVSLLPAVSKVFERAIYNRLMNFLSCHNILSQHQFGFRPKKSTELAIFNTVSYIMEQVDKNYKVAGLYFDLSKAFDTVDHRLLDRKLNALGIRGTCASLLNSYLTDRSQNVCVINKGLNYYSNMVKIKQGVPQGSILGPILFLLYANDLAEGFESGLVCQYADDTSVVFAGDSIVSLSRGCTGAVAEMQQWCSDNHLVLNNNKTGLVVFSKSFNSTESPYINLSGKSIPVVDHIRFLGVHLDSTLNYEHHIGSLVSRLNSYCSLIRRLKDVLTTKTLLTFYYAQIQSIISYGICFWGSSTHAMEVFITQKRIIRCMLGLHPRTSCASYFSQYGVLTVPSLYFASLVLFVKKNPTLFNINRDHYSADMNIKTRHGTCLSIPSHKSTFFEKGPYYRAVKAYYMLPSDIKQMESVVHFKKKLDHWLLFKCFYTFSFND